MIVLVCNMQSVQLAVRKLSLSSFLVNLAEAFLEHLLLGDPQPGKMHLDLSTKGLIALQDHVKALRSDLIAVVLKASSSKVHSL